MRELVALAAALAVFSFSASPTHAVEPDAPAQLIPSSEAFGIAMRQSLLRSGRNLSKTDNADRIALAEYYISRGHKSLWLTDNGFSDTAKSVMKVFVGADDWGLKSKDYTWIQDLSPDADDKTKIKAELALSLAILKYAREARGGRVGKPNSLSSYLDLTPPLKTAGAVFNTVLDSNDPAAELEDLHPKHEQFIRLRKKLLAMRNGTTEKVDTPVLIPTRGPTLRLDREHPDVTLLRKRLKVTDPTDNPELFDEFVLAAVKNFQSDNGLRPDGFVGRSTRRKLNGDYQAPPGEDQILANMEAWRWMPENLGQRYILVNIPEYKFRVVNNAEVVHEERVIVGKKHQQTPVFTDKMETVVLHPQWGVPNSIKVNEILPALARGRSLARQGLRIQRNGRDIDARSIDWSRADIRNYHVYQPSGRSNALGQVKFLFPNKHAVYLHDTPTKHLFKTNNRTYSHGCIRVRNPMRLAEVLLETDKGWQPEKVQSLVKRGPKNNSIPIETDILVHVGYFTAWVDDDGKLKTWKDIYGHEKRIKLALAGKYHLINRGRDHLAPVKYDRRRIARIQQQQPGFQGPQNLFEAIFGGF